MKYLVERQFISYELASDLIQKAIAHAKTINLAIVVAIVDSCGSLVAFARMDEANLIGIGSSQGKAFTAARSTLNTKVFAQYLEVNQVDIACLQHENLVPIAGGLPIIYQDKLIGGIGIGGGTAEQDEACALAALKSISG